MCMKAISYSRLTDVCASESLLKCFACCFDDEIWLDLNSNRANIICFKRE